MFRKFFRGAGLTFLLLTAVGNFVACSARQPQAKDAMAVNDEDPFNDPFFTQPPAWDDSVLKQSEVLAEKDEELQQPQTLLQKSEGIVFSTLIVGASLAKFAIPFLGF